MIYFDSFCRENKIRYYLFYGSLLGAAREKGFIPWDDDIDLAIPRKDYQKLVEIFNKKTDRYKLVSMHNNSDFTAPLAKIIDTQTRLIQNYGFKEKVELGIYIDIFVFDGLPSDEEERMECLKCAQKLTICWEIAASDFSYNKRNLIHKCVSYIYYLPIHILGYKYYLKKIDDFASRYDFDTSEYVSNLMLTSSDDAYRRKCFEFIELPFEGHKFYAPSGYEELLTQLYGDWRIPPSKEEQISHHNYECYLRE